EYELKTDNTTITFTWKKLRSTGIKVHYGSILLQLTQDTPTKLPILKFLNHSLQEIKQRDNKISDLLIQNVDLIKQRQDALDLANTAVTHKSEHEADTFQSF
ncbi:hypothetical protein, partial [Salmonella sp. s51228]|uniref:hypothetical protein n=1 Tax=Salmonella sp. s51228 TaxID=3159652 RepID=UPI003981803C